jgi:aminopeptidase N
MKLLIEGVADHRAGRPVRFPDHLAQAFGRVLGDAARDPAFAAEALALPPEVVIAEQFDEIDPEAVHEVRLAMRCFLAGRLQADLRRTYETFTTPGPYRPDAVSSGRRALRNLCLGYLVELADEPSRRLCLAQLAAADNMSDAMAALTAIANCDCAERRPALDAFYAKWKDEPLVVDKWLGVEALSRLRGIAARVKELTAHPAFTLKNPNKVYALLGSFGREPGQLPRGRRLRLRSDGRAVGGAGCDQSAGGLAHDAQFRTLQALRAQTPYADARRA